MDSWNSTWITIGGLGSLWCDGGHSALGWPQVIDKLYIRDDNEDYKQTHHLYG